MATSVCKRAGVLLAVLLVFSATGGRADDAAARPILRVSSEWEPDEAIALATAEAKLQVALRQWLTATRPATASIATPENLTRLLAFPNVRRTEIVKRKERPYGTVSRVYLSVQLPPTTIDTWRAELLKESEHRRNCLLMKIAGAFGSLGVLLVAVRVVDVRTKGYRRRSLGVVLAATVVLIFVATFAFAI